MNTIRSVGYGWVVLIAAGGGAYYFAKKNVNADREEKHRLMQERRAMNAQYAELERTQYQSSTASTLPNSTNSPVNPIPDEEKSKFEASEVWRSKKGDRLR